MLSSERQLKNIKDQMPLPRFLKGGANVKLLVRHLSIGSGILCLPHDEGLQFQYFLHCPDTQTFPESEQHLLVIYNVPILWTICKHHICFPAFGLLGLLLVLVDFTSMACMCGTLILWRKKNPTRVNDYEILNFQ